MTGEETRTSTNRFRAVLSRLARSMADLVSKNGRFWAVFRTIVLNDRSECAESVFSMRAVVL